MRLGKGERDFMIRDALIFVADEFSADEGDERVWLLHGILRNVQGLLDGGIGSAIWIPDLKLRLRMERRTTHSRQ